MKEITIEDVINKGFSNRLDTFDTEAIKKLQFSGERVMELMTEYASLNRQGWTRVEGDEVENQDSEFDEQERIIIDFIDDVDEFRSKHIPRKEYTKNLKLKYHLKQIK